MRPLWPPGSPNVEASDDPRESVEEPVPAAPSEAPANPPSEAPANPPSEAPANLPSEVPANPPSKPEPASEPEQENGVGLGFLLVLALGATVAVVWMVARASRRSRSPEPSDNS